MRTLIFLIGIQVLLFACSRSTKVSDMALNIPNHQFNINDFNRSSKKSKTEIYDSIYSHKKIQFFETRPRMPQGRIQTSIWDFNDIYIEGIEEILVKKIYYRAHKGNTRDIFDIAVGLSKNPDFFHECLTKEALSNDHLAVFKSTLNHIVSNQDLLKIYQDEIILMEPANEYQTLSTDAPMNLFKALEVL